MYKDIHLLNYSITAWLYPILYYPVCTWPRGTCLFTLWTSKWCGPRTKCFAAETSPKLLNQDWYEIW